jgi:hypothetical protein
MVCTTDFLTFQMLVLIGADSFLFLIANLCGKVREFILFGSGNPENGGVNSVEQQVQFCYKKSRSALKIDAGNRPTDELH